MYQHGIDKELLESVIDFLVNGNQTLAIAESCTGGFLSSCFTSQSGASNYFQGSMVAYSNDIKNKFLHIKSTDIHRYGVASQHVAELMAQNIKTQYATDFGLATTGYVDFIPNNNLSNHFLYAWVAISGCNFLVSKRVVLEKNRLEN